MGSPYQLILLNLIHIQGVLLGAIRVVAFFCRRARWRTPLLAWKREQERQLRVLIVLFRQIGGDFHRIHRGMLELSKAVGGAAGALAAILPLGLLRFFLRQTNRTLISGLERAGHQIAIADWAEWGTESGISPPKALLQLASERREWPSRWEGLGQFL